MAAHAVAEVNAPRQRGGIAVGVVVQARDEAADAPDGDADRERHDERIAGRFRARPSIACASSTPHSRPPARRRSTGP
jgi:hypothetical protein